MATELTLVEQLAFTTVRIECQLRGMSSVGTGFFFDCSEVDGKSMPVIITNKHVIENALSGTFRLTRASEDGTPLFGESLSFELTDFSGWVPHPIPDIDLCALPVARLFNRIYEDGERFIWRQLDKSIIPDSHEMAHLSSMEDVAMIGYPIGLWDSVNNMPIFRRGITATHPGLDYEGRKEFLIVGLTHFLDRDFGILTIVASRKCLLLII